MWMRSTFGSDSKHCHCGKEEVRVSLWLLVYVVLFWVCFGGMSCLGLSRWVDEWLTYGEGKVLHLFGGERHFDVLIAVFVRGKGGEYCYKVGWESFGVSRECDLLWSCTCCSRSRNAVLRRQTLRGSCLKVSADEEASEEE